MRKKSYRNKKRSKRIHKYVKIGSSLTRCGKEIEGKRSGYGGSLKWTQVTCPICLKNMIKKKAVTKLSKEEMSAADRVCNALEKVNEKSQVSVIMLGNPIDGMQVIGPFLAIGEATEWAYENCKKEDYLITPVKDQDSYLQ